MWHDWYIAQPLWLILLLVLGFIWYRWQMKGANSRPAVPLPALLQEHSSPSWRAVLEQVLQWCLALSLVLLVLALAEPRRLLVEEEVDAKGIDIMIAMDLSSSMLSQDFVPDRLTVSKLVAEDFVSKRRFDRIGVVPFAGEAFTLAPLSADHGIIQDAIASLQCGSLSDGTAIGMGLATAVNRLKDSEAVSKIVILLTDGENNAGYIDPISATALAKDFGIKVYTIGVGSEGMAKTPHSRRRDGSYIFSMRQVTIDEELLQDIAASSGGQYFRALTAADLQDIYDEIDALEKTDMEITVLRREQSYAYHLMVVAGGLWLIVHLLRYGYLQTWPD